MITFDQKHQLMRILDLCTIITSELGMDAEFLYRPTIDVLVVFVYDGKYDETGIIPKQFRAILKNQSDMDGVEFDLKQIIKEYNKKDNK